MPGFGRGPGGVVNYLDVSIEEARIMIHGDIRSGGQGNPGVL
jgi:hypothetical protein